MADREEIVLDLQVDQGSMIQELERTKSVIIGLKKEQQDLAKAYKAGQITQEEYAKELVRVEALLKTQQNTYNNTQKAVTGVKTKMDDLIASNKKLADSVKQSTENIRIGGVTVGELGAKLSALANPITATVGVVTALGAAYARSTIGAKDLEFASNQLSFATTLVTNEFAKLISSAEDGDGAFTKLLNSFLSSLGPLGTALAQSSKELANTEEIFQDLQRNEKIIRGEISELLADNQEKLTKIQDSQTKYADKVHLTGEIIENINASEKKLIENSEKLIKNHQLLTNEELSHAGVLTKQLQIVQQKLNADGESDKLLDERSLLIQQIAAVEKDSERKRQSILKLESNLLDTENKRLDTINKQNEALEFQQSEIERNARIARLEREMSEESGDVNLIDPETQNLGIDVLNRSAKVFRDTEEKKRKELKETNEAYKKYYQEQLELTEQNFIQLADLFSAGSQARRLFALAGIGADIAQAVASLTAASEANPANAFTFGGAGVAQYAAGIIRILANLAAAKEFLGGNFAGGGDFVTTKPTLLLVGDNPGNKERVTVEPLSGRGKTNFNRKSGLVSMAGGGSLTFDGQSANALTAVNQALAASNAVKNMPAPEVSVKEVTKIQKRVAVKENISKR